VRVSERPGRGHSSLLRRDLRPTSASRPRSSTTTRPSPSPLP